MKRTARCLIAAFVCAGVVQLVAPDMSQAGGYPTNQCVSKKTKGAGKFCQGVLKAWSKWHKNPDADLTGADRDAAILKAFDKLSSTWTKSEDATAKKSSDCVEATATATQISSDIENAIDALQASLGASVDDADRSCRSKILAATAKLCSGLLSAQSKYIRSPATDPDKDTLEAAQSETETAFTSTYDAEDDGCTTAVPASATVLGDVDEITDGVTEDTTTAPNGSLTFAQIIPDETVVYEGNELNPRCSKDTPYSFFYKRGTTNKLLMYYQGGGACWNQATCWTIGTYKEDAGAGDNPDLVGTGFADPDNVLNIFKEWHVVFVSYCTGDVHWGNHDQFYGGGQTTLHRGRVNAAVAEKFAREHFLDPEFVFVTGSSAGSYGAIMNSSYLMQFIYPQAEFGVLGDAGIGVITQAWLEQYQDGEPLFGRVWGLQENLPDFIPGIEPPIKELAMASVIEALAAAFPTNRFASYESAYDGGSGGQTSFYHVMKEGPGNIAQWPNWWEDQCEWTACMREHKAHIIANSPNYRSYTGAGSRHTMYGSDKVYTETTGLVPPITIRDWINAMITDDVGWVNVDCEDGGNCDLINTCQGGDDAGLDCETNADCDGGGECERDPRPGTTPNGPYQGGDVVTCSPTVCPCGPTGVNCP